MGQPPPPQGPFPGQPGRPPQGPPPGHGQWPLQGPPPGQPPQGPPPGYGQQPPQGPPGGFPPQGPPPGGQYPPGGPYPPGQGPQGAPKKKTGLVVGAIVGVVLLVAVISGIAIWASSGGEYVAMPDDCDLVFEGNALHDSAVGPLPSFNGGFTESDSADDGSYGELSCEGESGDLMVSFHVELFDPNHPDTEEEMRELLEEEFDPSEEFGAEDVEPGVVGDLDLGIGPGGQILWDESSIGDRGMSVASTMDTGEFGGAGGFAASVFLSDNAVGSVVIGTSAGGMDVEELYATVEGSASDLASRIPRVAE